MVMQVGTQFIQRANIYYERLLQVSGHTQDSVKAAALSLQRLKATERLATRASSATRNSRTASNSNGKTSKTLPTRKH